MKLSSSYDESQSIDRFYVSMKPNDLVTGQPRMAKDLAYAHSIQEAWLKDKATLQDEFSTSTNEATTTISKLYPFRALSDDNQHLHGIMSYSYLVRRNPTISPSNLKRKLPAILFFHTGAGPHDIFLQWKADTLVNNIKIFPEGCVIFIVDILGDNSGWAWDSNRTRYDSTVVDLLQPRNTADYNDQTRSLNKDIRPKLKSKLIAAINELKSLSYVDDQRLAAMGWCLGGHSILELARMELKSFKAMITFHGVFGECTPPPLDIVDDNRANIGRTLICHGTEDPYVSEKSLENVVNTLKYHGQDVSVLRIPDAKHGFTNPAQSFNPNPSFRYEPNGAHLAWTSALELLRCTITK
jgi:dienelactone hydrolase